MVTRTVFDRRRAERFAQLIAEDGGARRHHVRSEVDAELAPLVDMTRKVMSIPVSAEPDPEFRVGLRAMLMARIERDGIGATATEPEGVPRALATPPATVRPATTRRGRTRAAVFAGVAVGALAISGVSAASGDAMPGDGLYSVKRSTERAQLALASSDVTRGQLYLQFARVRLAEARSSSPRYLHDILLDMNAETRLGMKLLGTAAIDRRDAAALDTIDAFVAAQRQPLLDLGNVLSDAQRDEVLGAITILDSVAGRAQALRTAVRCGGSAGIDELGPRPRPCVAGGEPDGQLPRSSSTSTSNGTRPQVTASGGLSTTAPVPSPATSATTSASTVVPATSAETAGKDKKDKKEKKDSFLDKLGQLFGSLLGS